MTNDEVRLPRFSPRLQGLLSGLAVGLGLALLLQQFGLLALSLVTILVPVAIGLTIGVLATRRARALKQALLVLRAEGAALAAGRPPVVEDSAEVPASQVDANRTPSPPPARPPAGPDDPTVAMEPVPAEPAPERPAVAPPPLPDPPPDGSTPSA